MAGRVSRGGIGTREPRHGTIERAEAAHHGRRRKWAAAPQPLAMRRSLEATWHAK